jgi:hypothetical protein
MIPCPCRTPEGYRDPEWHIANPGAQFCNAQGFLVDSNSEVDASVKGFVQPIQSTRATRLQSEEIIEMFGEVQSDDHLGILPIEWQGVTLDFYGWSEDGDDWIEYDGRRFFSVNANKIADPSDGNPAHHWEVALRLMRKIP